MIGTSPTGSPLPTPNMTPSTPSRSIANPSALPGVNTPPASASNAPSGVRGRGQREGISPLTGLPFSEIPTTSSATAPVRADGTVVDGTMRNTTAATGREPIIPAGSESLPASQRDAAQTQAASTSPVNGTFQQPPTPGATWVPGTYDPAARQWTDGHWEQTGAPRR